ncbi:DUF2273 domain-containing protein [Olsenella sp. Marseille-P4559]|jgi:uncharacterized membrane protein|uniref:DUF2273 domain-containing protein n=1 Tax=Olsenella sp. Marseille-P4559 TaxID=2364795 RepID=UPI001031125B|nr:DUF2273 domain-containing protein [Olsenella sp. Marseille-P4559]
MSDEFNKAPRAKVEAEAPQAQRADEHDATKASTETPRTDATPGKTTPEGSQSGVDKVSAWVSRTFPGHENAFLGGVCGLIVAIVMAAIGFWRALLLVLLVLVGVAIGQKADGDPKIWRAISKLFRDHEIH